MTDASSEPADGYSSGVRTLAERPARGSGFVFDGLTWVTGQALLAELDRLRRENARLRRQLSDTGGEGG